MKSVKCYLKSSQVVVHAGGMGERWRPVDGDRPKPLTPVGKNPRPMLEWVVLPWVAAGVEEFFVTTWHKSKHIQNFCRELSKRSGIEFHVLVEPPEKRLGRAGIIKVSLENGWLDERRPIISTNASDILKVNVVELLRYHLRGLEEGFYLTVLGAKYLPCQFGVVEISEDGRVKSFVEKPLIRLENKFINTGVVVIDPKLFPLFKGISEVDFPVDLESTEHPVIRKLWRKGRVYLKAVPWKNWIFLKDLKDYKRVCKVDLEKFLDIPVRSYLGDYTAGFNGKGL